jgi:hypothetical protein
MGIREAGVLCAALTAACSGTSHDTTFDAGRSGDGGGASSGGGPGFGGNGAGGRSSGTAGAPGTGAGPGSGGVSGRGAGGALSHGSGGGPASKRPFPDTTSKIAVLADQLPDLTAAQRTFAATHYVGSQKLTLDQSTPLRAIDPDFLVLHYHLSMWQSAPSVSFITDGAHWGNDYPTVNQHEDWFWHDASNQRVASTADAKLLMDIGNSGFQQYWADSLAAQVAAGDYDGVFFDSASPALLQAEVGGQDARLAGTGARDSVIPELGNRTFIQAWEAWMSALDAALAAKGIPLVPNTSAFVTSWDDTDYSLTAGAFVEGFADPTWSADDWKASTNTLLSLAAKHKILILQNYLGSVNDTQKRFYYLGNYLLVKGDRTYLDYFASGPLEWYPEWLLDLGAPSATAATVDDLARDGVFRRDYANGIVLVNPTSSSVDVPLGGTYRHVIASGGGAVDANGDLPGALLTVNVTSLPVAATSAEILLK